MAITLIGTIANPCDAATGFSAGAADTDIFVEPNASIGLKTSNTTTVFTTSSLTSGPYNFASGGGQFGYHIVVWFNGLTPINATTGFQIVVTNGTNSGRWNVPPGGGYTGGFRPKVVNTARNFDVVSGFSASGNPAQLTSISNLGGAITTTTTVMGNFNNALVDQFTIGLGLRGDGTGNSFETFRVADEDTTHWGWVTSFGGSYIVKGGLYLGPVSGTATSTFSDTAAVVTFANEAVAVGFYQINIRGANTTVNFNGCIVRSESPANARWSLIIDSTSQPNFNDNASLLQGFNTLTLQSDSTLNGTTLDDGQSIVQNGATIANCSILNADTTSGEALILSNNPSNISNNEFTASGAGHAIEFDSTGTFSLTGNVFNGYDSTIGSNNAAVYNNSGGLVTLNVTGATSPSYRNGVDATTQINNTVNVTISGLVDNTEVRIYETGTTTVVAGTDDATAGTPGNRSFTFSDEPGDFVDIIVHHVQYKWIRIVNFEIPGANTSVPVQQQFDRNYSNP